tara:strand:+ start:2693 stop:3814 length:1122 start_codon:yes stop_codon:yes gene_type:complete
MSTLKIYNVIGIMTGTSMDGLDLSLIETDGKKFSKILFEKSYDYSENYRNKLRKLILNLPNTKKKQIKYIAENEEFITNLIVKNIKKFLNNINYNKKIDLIGFSGQTIYHNPEKGYSLQIGSGDKIYKEIKIPVVSNFRENDMKNGGEGAPIGSYYHKHIINKIKGKKAILNLGGIANITFVRNRKIISYDLGPANSLIDDLSYYFYKKNYDNKGLYASKGYLIKKINNKFNNDIFFKKKYPKSLDRNYFYKYFKILKKNKPNDAIYTASIMTINSIVNNLKSSKISIKELIITGGGRKNKFIVNNLHKKLKKINIKLNLIDHYNYNGDFIESQMFGYLAVRSIKKLTISCPTSTGVEKELSGGMLFGKLSKC